MARGRGRGSGGRVGKSTFRDDSTGRANMPTISIPTTVSPQQGGTSFIGRPDPINQVQTLGTPSAQASDMAREKGRGSEGRVGKSSLRGDSASHANMPTIPIATTVSPQQGGTSFIGGPYPINHVQTFGTPSVQVSGRGSTPTIPELSPITPDLSSPIDEGTSNQSNTISEDESSSRRRQRTLTLVTLTPTRLEPSKECSNTISASFKNQLDPNGINWKDPKCVEKSEINAKNRCGGKEVAAGTHTGGSICIGEHRKRLVVFAVLDSGLPRYIAIFLITMLLSFLNYLGLSIAVEKGRDPTPGEERYQEILWEKLQSQSDIDQCEGYYEAVGGTRKRRIYGLGSQAQSYYGPNLRVNSGFNASTSAPPSTSQSAPTENMEELVMRLIPTLTDHLLPLFIKKARGVISSPSHHPNTPIDKPSVVTPIVPPTTTANVDDGDPLVSDGDRSPSPMH
ncbi:uncharacterized protein LOC132630863 [Lycium barbarum]|uniref:uncharacterized protein LOC132630863 n=1 Tax=Lycium barbarum TaxID=112863 RepID=UPI00293ED7F1|nr:uncharacterized protein LOC132630863 [Lycium barbarum]